MLLIISDASVLIDMEHGRLTDVMFSLPFKFAVPDTLFVEELLEHHAHLSQSGLIIKSMKGELVAEAYKFHKKYIKTSVNDMLALVLAKHENCQLLTGDKALRAAAIEFNIEVHGTIWLVEQMILNKRITIERAQKSFNRMRNSGSRLPWSELEKILNQDGYIPILQVDV